MNGLGESNLMLMLGGIAAVFAVTFFFFVRSLLESRERRLAQRLREVGAEDEEKLDLDPDPALKPLGEFLGDTGTNLTAEQALGWMTFAGTVAACLLFLLRPEWWVGMIGLVLGTVVVWVFLLIKRFRYQLMLQEQMPDTFFLLARSLRAGLSLEQALLLVGNQGAEPLATEFRRANNQIHLGLTIPTALGIMAKRLKVNDFNNLVSTVGLYTVTGGNLPLMLDRLAASTRDQNQFRAFFRSATALGRMSSFFIAGAGPFFFIVYALMEPEYAEFFFTSQAGLATLIVVVFLEAIGLFWLWNIIRLDY
ncbi:MAG: type II secretion system F family protein [Planctomycetota bacterium]|jgi:tight adherence protein B